MLKYFYSVMKDFLISFDTPVNPCSKKLIKYGMKSEATSSLK
jgi:hypothetical protein